MSSGRQLAGGLSLAGKPRWAEPLEVFFEGLRPVNIVLEIGTGGPDSLGPRATRVGADVIDVGFVETVTLVWIRAVRRLDDRVHREEGNRRAIRVTPDLFGVYDLLRGEDDRGGRDRDIGVHVWIPVDLCV